MTQWFRRGSPNGSGAGAGSADAPPTPPGGTGGSGFFAVGGVPAGPEAVPTAAEQRDIAAGRLARPESSPRTPAGDTPSTGNGTGSRTGSRNGTGRGAGGNGNGNGQGPADARRVRPVSGGSSPAATPEERRFAQVYSEDRVGPMPYPNQAVPDVAAARSRVRAHVDDLLPNGVDEGTGAALDPLIASWASGWLARIDSEHADHHAVVDRLIGGARRQLAEAEAAHERDRRALEIARTDYHDARDRLSEPEAPPVPPTPSARAARSGSGPGRLRRLADRLPGRRTSPSPSPSPSRESAASQEPAAPGAGVPAPHGAPGTSGARDPQDERVGPSEPATRPVPIPPSTYGATFPERSAPGGPSTREPDDPASRRRPRTDPEP